MAEWEILAAYIEKDDKGVDQWSIKVQVPPNWIPTGKFTRGTNSIALEYKYSSGVPGDTDVWYTNIIPTSKYEDHDLSIEVDKPEKTTTEGRKRTLTMATTGGGGGEAWRVTARFKGRLKLMKYRQLEGPRIPILGPLFHSFKRWF